MQNGRPEISRHCECHISEKQCLQLTDASVSEADLPSEYLPMVISHISICSLPRVLYIHYIAPFVVFYVREGLVKDTLCLIKTLTSAEIDILNFVVFDEIVCKLIQISLKFHIQMVEIMAWR